MMMACLGHGVAFALTVVDSLRLMATAQVRIWGDVPLT